MKHFIVFIVAIFLALFFNQAAAFGTDTILGRWGVKEINFLTDEVQGSENSEVIKKLFLNSKFEFKSDNSFIFQIDNPEMRIRKGQWKYIEKTRSYIILNSKTNPHDKTILMEISVKREENKVFFLISETPFILRVVPEN